MATLVSVEKNRDPTSEDKSQPPCPILPTCCGGLIPGDEESQARRLVPISANGTEVQTCKIRSLFPNENPMC